MALDHDLAGVSFRVSGLRAPIRPQGGVERFANGVELLRECSFGGARALIGVDVPGLGVVLDVGSPRVDPLPIGARLNLVTAAAAP